jgi:PIN domain nuclease of toxin-antitoxin system
MQFLLDTQILVWSLDNNPRLGADLREILSDAANQVFFSAASIWELSIKSALKKLAFGIGTDRIVQAAAMAGLTELPVFSTTAALVAKLPLHHRDPFDRLLVVQAMANGLTLVTTDPWLPRYTPLVMLIE